MTEDAKKVWKVMERDFGWSNQPKDFHLEYFEDIVKSTKQALRIHDVVGRSEQCSGCNESTGETKLWCCNHCGKRIEDF